MRINWCVKTFGTTAAAEPKKVGGFDYAHYNHLK